MLKFILFNILWWQWRYGKHLRAHSLNNRYTQVQASCINWIANILCCAFFSPLFLFSRWPCAVLCLAAMLFVPFLYSIRGALLSSSWFFVSVCVCVYAVDNAWNSWSICSHVTNTNSLFVFGKSTMAGYMPRQRVTHSTHTQTQAYGKRIAPHTVCTCH